MPKTDTVWFSCKLFPNCRYLRWSIIILVIASMFVSSLSAGVGDFQWYTMFFAAKKLPWLRMKCSVTFVMRQDGASVSWHKITLNAVPWFNSSLFGICFTICHKQWTIMIPLLLLIHHICCLVIAWHIFTHATTHRLLYTRLCFYIFYVRTTRHV